uniref:Uncharacterized protein n=1 Tax=Candidatus Kentrum sp. LFY TaxID=2126342 RepID=A0A450UP19_9GAMM|nr:MAG: hypothetical protein BECKLFY1418B_GA0070995_10569 [Candidatus Kentron sp. LFY]
MREQVGASRQDRSGMGPDTRTGSLKCLCFSDTLKVGRLAIFGDGDDGCQ